jgi:hypothetical protein
MAVTVVMSLRKTTVGCCRINMLLQLLTVDKSYGMLGLPNHGNKSNNHAYSYIFILLFSKEVSVI